MNISYGTMKLSDVFIKIKNGVITVPSFQRSFDWSARDIARMYNSVMHRKEPFGSIVIWDDTDNSGAIPNNSKIFTQIQEKQSDNNKTYLIDGQQRVTSFLMSYLWNEKPGAKHIKRIKTIRYDLDKKEFLVLAGKEKDSYIKPFVFSKSKREEVLSAVESDLAGKGLELSRAWERNLLETFDAFANIDIGTTTIVSNDLNEVIDVFTLINTKGKKLTAFNIVHAQYISHGKGYNLAAKYEKISNLNLLKDKWKISFTSLMILQYAVRHNTISNTDILRLSSNSAKMNEDKIFIDTELETLWRLTVSELKSFGYHTLDSVPTDKFIYLLAKALKYKGNSSLSTNEKRIFKNWFKLAVLNNRYSSGGEGAKINGFKSDWEELKNQLDNGIKNPSWTKITEFTTRDVRELKYGKSSLIYKYVISKMVANIPSIKTGTLVSWDDISDLKKLNLHHLIPSGHPDFREEDGINSLANLTPLGAKDNIEISNDRLSTYIKEYVDIENLAVAEKYLLNVSDFDNLKEFIEERSQLIAMKLNDGWE